MLGFLAQVFGEVINSSINIDQSEQFYLELLYLTKSHLGSLKYARSQTCSNCRRQELKNLQPQLTQVQTLILQIYLLFSIQLQGKLILILFISTFPNIYHKLWPQNLVFRGFMKLRLRDYSIYCSEDTLSQRIYLTQWTPSPRFMDSNGGRGRIEGRLRRYISIPSRRNLKDQQGADNEFHANFGQRLKGKRHNYRYTVDEEERHLDKGQFIVIIVLFIVDIYINFMTSRKLWLPEEDLILKELFEVRRVKKWSKIAMIMLCEYNILDLNGKKCRERYHNYLNPVLNKNEWSMEEEKTLIALHNEHGNSWASIAKRLPGRTDNSVKNKFYSKMRKSIKNINCLCLNLFNRKSKDVKVSFIYKLIEIIEERKSEKPLAKDEVIDCAENVKREILAYEHLIQEDIAQDLPRFEELMKNIAFIRKNFIKKRKGRKFRRFFPSEDSSFSYSVKEEEDSNEFQDEYICSMDEEEKNNLQTPKKELQVGLPVKNELRETEASLEKFDGSRSSFSDVKMEDMDMPEEFRLLNSPLFGEQPMPGIDNCFNFFAF